jgi:TPR repeat protein
LSGLRATIASNNDSAQSGPAWFNLGLAHKGWRDWPASARCYRRAAELDDRNEEAFWNLGRAYTALRESEPS